MPNTKRLVTVEATIPEFKAHSMYQTARSQCVKLQNGIAACVREIMQRDGVKHKRFHVMKLNVSWLTVEEEGERKNGGNEEAPDNV